ncbi:MAG: hypothetical protein J5746_00670 [Victivallales bacterium]|nr:hypothetical protein [Victivallales bacterium]
MKRILFFALSLMLLCVGLRADDSEYMRDALNGALEEAKAAIPQGAFRGKAVAVLPFLQDSTGILTGRVKNMLTSAGLVCLEGKEDPMWDEIIKEVAWNERKDDILDPATLLKFGKLKSAQVLVYGMVTALDANSERVYAEIDIHATELATRRHLWGGTFARRIYKDSKLQGIVSITPELRQLLKKGFEEGKASLREPAVAARMTKVRSVAVVDLAGDIDKYMTGLAVGMLTETSYTPKHNRISSVQQFRGLIREGHCDADAFLYGAVRDLSQRVVEVILDSEKRQKIVRSTLNAEVQLFIEDVREGTVLWSRTISVSEPLQTTQLLTEEEMTSERERIERERQAEREIEKRKQKEKIEDVPDNIKAEVADNWKSILKWIGIGIGAVVVLVVLLVIFKVIMSNVFIR